jgi:ribose transport system permease protein
MKKNKLSGFLSSNAGILLIIFMFIVFSLVSSSFLNIDNILNILQHGSVLGILSLGLTYVIILGEMDISFANLLSFAGVLVAIFLTRSGYSIVTSILLTAAISVLLGAANGFFIGYRKYPSVAVTLATANLFLGLNYTFSGGRPVYGSMPQAFLTIGQGSLSVVPVSVIIFLVVMVLTYFIIHRTIFGQNLYAIGSNQEAARVMGINVSLMKFLAFVISSLYISLAAIISTSRLGSGQPVIGGPYLLETLAAVFLGQALSARRIPTVTGTFEGTLVLSILFNGVTLLGFPSYIYQLIVGAVLIITLFATMKRVGVENA